MNKLDFFRALGDIDDDLIEDAQKLPQKRRLHWGPVLAACACLALVVLAWRFLPPGGGQTKDSASPEVVNPAAQNRSTMASEPYASVPEIVGQENVIAPQSVDTEAGTGGEVAAPPPDYGDYPQDFQFFLTWGGKTYDSAAGTLTDESGNEQALPLTPEQRQSAWMLLSGLEAETAQEPVYLTITCTWDGTTRTASARENDYGPALSIGAELIHLITGEEIS